MLDEKANGCLQCFLLLCSVVSDLLLLNKFWQTLSICPIWYAVDSSISYYFSYLILISFN